MPETPLDSDQRSERTYGIVHCGHWWREVVNPNGLWLWNCFICGAWRNVDGRIR